MNKIFFSVATFDYLSQLLCAEKSFFENNQITKSYIFVVDAKKEQIELLNKKFLHNSNRYNFFCFDDAEEHHALFENASTYYDNFEMSCFAKAVGIKYILNEINDDDIIIYCDADLYFKSSIDPLIKEMSDSSVFLTPHIIIPEKDSQFEQGYLIHGWINAGFMMFKKGDSILIEILDWLIERIYLRGFNAPSLFMFVDQAWISAMPFLFHEHICISKNSAANVAYWNLNERNIKFDKSDQKYKVDFRNLIFFHFSGYTKNKLKNLSKHYSFSLPKNEYADLYNLINEYNDALLDAEKYDFDIGSSDNNLYIFSNSKLRKRLLISEKINQTSLVNTNLKEGILSKVARRIEAFYLT